jgi:hypothetical protein
MKKNSIIAAVILSATLFSCTKESLQQNPVSKTTPPATTPTQVRIVSDWLSLSLTNAVFNSASSLQGKHQLSSPVSYDYDEYVQLAFERSRGRESYVYEKLPMNVGTSQGNVRLDFILDYSSFTINIWNADSPAERPAAQQFTNMQYRFIVIPKSTYQALNIDWSDYTAVAAALNL